MEYEAIHADLLVPMDTNVIYETLLVAQCAQSREEPAVTSPSLSDITSCGAIYVEVRIFEYLLS